ARRRSRSDRSTHDPVAAEDLPLDDLRVEERQLPALRHEEPGTVADRRGVLPAEDRRCQRDVQLVEQVVLDEPPVEIASALDEEALDPVLLLQPGEQLAEIYALLAEHPHLGHLREGGAAG